MFSIPTTRSKGSGRKPTMDNTDYVGASREMAKVGGDNYTIMTADSENGTGVSLRMWASSIISALPSFLFGWEKSSPTCGPRLLPFVGTLFVFGPQLCWECIYSVGAQNDSSSSHLLNGIGKRKSFPWSGAARISIAWFERASGQYVDFPQRRVPVPISAY